MCGQRGKELLERGIVGHRCNEGERKLGGGLIRKGDVRAVRRKRKEIEMSNTKGI